jgi:UTP:GlnB (protein PII) uridylyltransferase
MHLSLSDLTSARLEAGEFKATLPEVYALSETLENNSWHNNQNVFEHTVSVLKNLEQLIKLWCQEKPWLKIYLEQPYYRYSRQHLLVVATILHDIAKPQTLIVNEEGLTSCPGHERIGSTLALAFFERFVLDDVGQILVNRIVRDHDFPGAIVALAEADAKVATQYLKEFARHYCIELLLLSVADAWGCNGAKSIDQLHHEKKVKEVLEILKNII